ncbi:MAG: mechanosensitive ion channel family protein [Salinibacter sp.]
MDPSFLDQFVGTGPSWLWSVGLLGGAALLGLLGHALLLRLVRRLFRGPGGPHSLRDALLRRLPGPLRLLVPTGLVYAVLPGGRDALPPEAAVAVDGVLFVGLIGAATWLVVAVLLAAEEAVSAHYTTDAPNNLRARRIVTQVRILRRIASVIIVVLAVGLVLLQYEPFRELGTGILASAGIVGIVAGVAAQNTLSDLIAGIQIALTQPIRVDDVVIVEGEFGWVEEITLTYVVVRVWDRRRIVMPITHFVEKPFQNWTRTSTDLIGSVFLRVDHRTPVAAVRDELRRVVEASEYWDGDACALHVTDTTERAIELRAIASAENAPRLWELRCEIREALVAYLRDHHPEALPTIRAQMQAAEGAGGPGTAPDEQNDQ